MIKKVFLSVVVFASFMLMLSACSPKIPFTDTLHRKLIQDSVDIRKVQFYNSEEIVLNREQYKDEEVNVSNGQITFENGKTMETVVIRKHTPAVCVNDSVNSLFISFESEGSLEFGRESNGKLIPIYRLYALDWQEGIGVLHYGDSLYYTQQGAGASHLLVKKSQVYSLMKERRVAKGRTVSK